MNAGQVEIGHVLKLKVPQLDKDLNFYGSKVGCFNLPYSYREKRDAKIRDSSRICTEPRRYNYVSRDFVR